MAKACLFNRIEISREHMFSIRGIKIYAFFNAKKIKSSSYGKIIKIILYSLIVVMAFNEVKSVIKENNKV